MEKKNVESGEILLEVKNLKKYYPVRTGFIKKTELKAVDDVSFFIRKGETLGIVGESGCGKTTLGRTVLRLEEPTSGDIIYEGESIIGKNMKEYRKKMQIVFQDPYASLDPRKTVSDIIGEAMDIQKLCKTKEERRDKILELMKLVGLNAEFYNRFPHEFSGGQRQRIGIARALAVDPGLHHLRRTGICAGCFHPGTDHQYAGGTAGDKKTYLSFYRPRSGHRKAYQYEDRRYVSGPYGGAGRECGAVPQSDSSLHGDASFRDSDCGSGSFRGKKTDQAGGRGAKPLKSSVRLSFPDPVSESRKSLCGKHAGASGDHPGPFRRLP